MRARSYALPQCEHLHIVLQGGRERGRGSKSERLRETVREGESERDSERGRE